MWVADSGALGHYQSMTYLIPTPTGYRISGPNAPSIDGRQHEFLISADLIDTESLAIRTALPAFRGQPDIAELIEFMKCKARGRDIHPCSG